MFITALAAISLAVTPAVGPEASKAAPEVIRLWISDDRQFVPGERVRVQVETGSSGYLLVLRFDAEGNLRVLFPVDPGDDGSVQSGRRYELRDPGADQSFLAEDFGGAGLIFAALSKDPFRMETFLGTGGGWDYGALKIAIETQNPEADLTTLVQQMSSSAGFDYDVLDYWVDGPLRHVEAAGTARPTWWSPDYDSYGTAGVYTTMCGSCPYDGGSVHVSIGFGIGYGWYSPYWYDPYYYSYFPGGWYYPPYWSSGYYPGYYPPYVGYPSNYPQVVGRTRDYTVERYGSRPRPEPNDPSAPSGVRQAGGVSADGNQARRARGSTGSQRPDGGSMGEAGRSAQPRSGESSGGGATAQPKGGAGRDAPLATRARPRGDRPAPGSKAASTQRIAGGAAASNPVNVARSRPTSNRQETVRFNNVNSQRTQAQAPQARKVDRGGSNRSTSAASQARSRSSGIFRGSNRAASAAQSGSRSPSASSGSGSSGRSGGSVSSGRSSGGSSGGSAPRSRGRP